MNNHSYSDADESSKQDGKNLEMENLGEDSPAENIEGILLEIYSYLTKNQHASSKSHIFEFGSFKYKYLSF